MPEIELRVLGAVDVRREAESLRRVLTQPRRLALLVYLAMAGRDGPVRRDVLLSLFWPESDSSRARGALRNALHFLRDALGPDALPSVGAEDVTVDRTRVSCDAVALEAALDAGRREEAVDRYAELLPGFHVSDAPEFERWLDEERARIHRRVLDAAGALADEAAGAGAYELAGRFARRAVTLASTDERAAARLIELLARVGDRAGALRAFDELATRLAEELEVRPSRALRELVETVRDGRLAPAAPLVVPSAASLSAVAESKGIAEPSAATPRAPTPLSTSVMRPSTPPVTPERGSRRRWSVPLATVAVLAVLVLALVRAGRDSALGHAPRAGDRAGGSGTLMVAVLPFDHAGPADEAVFTDGLTDAVTAKLGALPGLAVIDRHSAAQYAHSTKPARQIGAELGVPWLVEGIVRWARDAGGRWRAQVTPTLVDARTGTTKWTGTPEVITPADPFTAQGEIARHVAEELDVVLRPSEATRLRARMTNDPEAFAAYTRGLALFDALGRVPTSPAELDRIRGEFARAIERDSTFGEAWTQLALVDVRRALIEPGSAAAAARSRGIVAQALARAPDQPLALVALAEQRLGVDHDTSGVDTLARRAAAGARNDATALGALAYLLWRWAPDSAYAFSRRAAELDPRSGSVLFATGLSAERLRRWADTRRAADALLALDSADERGWRLQLDPSRLRGDTLALRRDLAAALAHVPHPSNVILQFLAYAGGPSGTRFVMLRPRDLGVASLMDSVDLYYDNKADAFSARGDEAGARIYRDSIRVLLRGRSLGGNLALLEYRALSDAALGDTAAARHALADLRAAAQRVAREPDLADALAAPLMAGTFARLGQPDSVRRWMELALAHPTGWTSRGFALLPKLHVLRGTPAFEHLVRSRPE